MSKFEHPDNNYTLQVKQLIEDVYPKDDQQASVYADARSYFTASHEQQGGLEELKLKLSRAESDRKAQAKVEQLRKQVKDLAMEREESRYQRVERLHSVASRLLSLCEGESFDDTQMLSSKFLGTLMLLTRGPERNFAVLHKRLKPLYKAVLALRLVDKLHTIDVQDNRYLGHVKESVLRFQKDEKMRKKWQEEVAIPIISCALLQDIGLQAPEAQNILHGDDNSLDEFRVLDEPSRKQLLKINFTETLEYLKNGLGMPRYIGNDKAERDRFVQRHTALNVFMQTLMKDSYLSKTGVGELIKIPQIYTSIVLSTKPDFSKKNLPKGYVFIEQLAKKGAISAGLAKAFVQIVGYFPLGFGVTYIPRSEKGIDREQYECAIVTRLNPAHPAEPVVRPVTRNLAYISSGSDEVVKRSSNLYFPANRKKLLNIGRERLMEIMSLLSASFSPEAVDDLIPAYWEPADYFSFKKNQNLWNRVR
ncbi:hypothetical protein [Alteromonas lipolytica]|uniref:Uncharacterized protein n=1 Tax=Alteromonas lipolytica TaxID=1856405 RepID=A0A1E8FJV0_9ALTE|nr:hypothetical protein [Alteromonas lipolytica]OFI36217.1 hypothetical protein BFC17_08835 [Alteromonas lipolytica]GGF78854.1 hypothetical protein GCM10011338_33990 [Alteromonas lipolytica]